jgi:hypothetical protein
VIDGFDALGAIGGDRALTALHTFANLSWPLTLKRKARAKFDDVAHAMDLTMEQLADHTVPTLGLSAEGTLDLDYGTRRFTVSIDELLRLVVTDENGSVLRAFPKPGKRDDPEMAPAAYKRFALLKKEAQHVTQEQIGRLEQAMVRRRRWSPEDFSAHLVPHLLLGRIVRRLVWGVYAGDGELLGSFRVAEDSSFADHEDAHYEVPEGGLVGVAHPVDLAEAVGRWSEVFADYEILQPFPQLGRVVHRLTDDEAVEGRLARFEGVTVPVGKVLGLERRGWRRGEPQDAGVERWIAKQLPDGRFVVIDLDPGIAVGAIDMLPEQKLDVVWLADAPQDYWPNRGITHRFGELDPMTASELLADLTELTETAVR